MMAAMSGEPREKAWDERIFELVPSGVDVTLIDENLKLTPTERLEKMCRVLAFVQDVKRESRDRLPPSR
jgi:hypothetical protein